MIYAKGILLGLGLFVLWVAAMVGIVLAAFYWQYWLWAVFPAAFIAFGIRMMLDHPSLTRSDTKGEGDG